MTKITDRQDNVVYVDFTPQPKKPRSNRRMPSGVFIKPVGLDTTMWVLKGNIAGFIASYIAFHPDFSPSLFGKQVREELGVSVANNDFDPPPEAA
jgi:hypothetical protein